MPDDRAEPDASKPPGGVLSFDQVLEMTREEAAQVVGIRAWDIAYLNRLLNEALAGREPPPAQPPSLFVSYRWKPEAHRAWVRQLVADLKGRGYDVFFDEDIQADRPTELPVPELVSLITRARSCLMVINEGYLERIEADDRRGTIRDGWVWDEFQTALQLHKMGRLNLMVAWRSGPLPDWAPEDQALDFRDDAGYEALLDEVFPVRYAHIIGVRPDGSRRIVGPIERTRIDEVGRQLEATGEFGYFLIRHD